MEEILPNCKARYVRRDLSIPTKENGLYHRIFPRLSILLTALFAACSTPTAKVGNPHSLHDAQMCRKERAAFMTASVTNLTVPPQFTLMAMTLDSMIKDANAGMVIISTPILAAAAERAVAVQMANGYIAAGEASVEAALAAEAAGDAAAAAKHWNDSVQQGYKGLEWALKAKAARERMLAQAAASLALLDTLLMDIAIIINGPPPGWFHPNLDGRNPYQNMGASNDRGYWHLQWGGGGPSLWDRLVDLFERNGEGDAYASWSDEDPAGDNPGPTLMSYGAGGLDGITPRSEDPFGTIMFSALLDNVSWRTRVFQEIEALNTNQQAMSTFTGVVRHEGVDRAYTTIVHIDGTTQSFYAGVDQIHHAFDATLYQEQDLTEIELLFQGQTYNLSVWH